jgi:hypothetical protein
MLICNYFPISLEYKFTDWLMRHIGGGVGHCDTRAEEQYEDDSEAEGLEPDDDEQMGAAGEIGSPNECEDEDAAAEESDSEDYENEEESGTDDNDLGPEDGEDGAEDETEDDPYDDL